MNRLLVIVVLVLAVSCLVSGQQQAASPPKSGPEALRLGTALSSSRNRLATLKAVAIQKCP